MRGLIREWRDWLPMAFLAAVLLYALIASVFISLKVAEVGHELIVQQQADHQTLIRHEALLKRVEADEQHICTAARTAVADGGSSALVTILCPKPS